VSERTERFSKLLKEELSELLFRGVKDPRVSEAGLLTITQIRVSDDLGVARVYVSLFGADEEKERALLKGLQSASPFLHTELGRRLRIKKIPELRFSLDSSSDHVNRVESLLKEIAEEKRRHGHDP
jgi:ribosome-binding factor A